MKKFKRRRPEYERRLRRWTEDLKKATLAARDKFENVMELIAEVLFAFAGTHLKQIEKYYIYKAEVKEFGKAEVSMLAT